MKLDLFKAHLGSHERQDVRYLPIPNTVDVVLTSDEAPQEITRSAFVLPLFDNGDMLFANNQRRGLEIPGGHLEPGETPVEAAIRECYEEGGCEVQDLVPIGFLRMNTRGEKPEGYRYPYPLGAQQFFAGRVRRIVPYIVNDECGIPHVASAGEARKLLRPHDLAFYEQGMEALRLSAIPPLGIR